MTQKMNGSRRESVLGLREEGLTYAEIGRKLGITGERVRQIINGNSTAKKKQDRNDENALLSTGQAAVILNVHVNTIRRWSNEGLIKAYRIGPRGDRRFKRQDVASLLQEKR